MNTDWEINLTFEDLPTVIQNLVTKSSKPPVVLNDFESTDPEWGSQGLRPPDSASAIKRKDCSWVHYDYDDKNPGVNLLVSKSVEK